jgi:hypothetical protein
MVLVPVPASRASCQTTRIGHHGTLTEPWGSGTSSIGGRLRLGPSGVCPQELLGEEVELDIEERDTVLDADSGQQVWQLFSTRSGSVISPA